LQADIRIVTLPEGTDPDNIIRTDPELWPQLIEQAKPVVEYVIDVAAESLDMGDAKAKAAVAEQVLPLIDDVNNPVEREHYRQLLARRLQIDERVLLKVALPTKPKRTPPQQAKGGKTAGKQQIQDAESKGFVVAISGSSAASDMRRADFLRQCLAYPQVINQVDNQLAQNQQPVVSEADFSRLDDRSLWRQLKGRQSQRPIAAIDDLWDSSEDEFLRERVLNLLTLPDTPESELDRLPDRLVLSVLDWRLERIKSLIAELELLKRETRAQDNPEMHEMYNRQLRELPMQRLSIDRARGAMSATGRRQKGAQNSLRRKPLGTD
jgi:DNA primase